MAQIIHLPSVTSTNDYLSELLQTSKIEEATVVCTDFQTKGRGNAANCWESENAQNLLFSIVLYPEMIDISNQFVLSQLASLAVVELLAIFDIPQASIKFPNDIYVGERKVAGILIENRLQGENIKSSIIGIGLNVNQQLFLSDAPNPVSMRQLSNREFDLKQLARMLRSNIIEQYFRLSDREESLIVSEYHSKLYRKSGYHPYKAGSDYFHAKIQSVSSNGQLILETESGEIRKFSFKEIEFVINN